MNEYLCFYCGEKFFQKQSKASVNTLYCSSTCERDANSEKNEDNDTIDNYDWEQYYY